jgi:hypothetical protein
MQAVWLNRPRLGQVMVDFKIVQHSSKFLMGLINPKATLSPQLVLTLHTSIDTRRIPTVFVHPTLVAGVALDGQVWRVL